LIFYENKVHEYFLIIFGIIIGIFWYIFGAQDSYVINLYKMQLNYVKKKLKTYFKLNQYDYVGQSSNILMTALPKCSFFSWRCELISTTKLPAIFPVIVIMVWIVVLFQKVIS
jgi:hypothetical protein